MSNMKRVVGKLILILLVRFASFSHFQSSDFSPIFLPYFSIYLSHGLYALVLLVFK